MKRIWVIASFLFVSYNVLGTVQMDVSFPEQGIPPLTFNHINAQWTTHRINEKVNGLYIGYIEARIRFEHLSKGYGVLETDLVWYGLNGECIPMATEPLVVTLHESAFLTVTNIEGKPVTLTVTVCPDSDIQFEIQEDLES